MAKNPHAVALGRLGGAKSGRKVALARWAKMTAEERSAYNRKVVRARWAKTTAAQRTAFAKRIWRIRRKREK